MQFQYADKSGKLQTIDAASQEAALSQVATLSPGSGVMPAPQNNVQTQGATQNVVQDKNPISSNSYTQNQLEEKTIQSALNPQSNVKPLNDLQNRVMQFVGTTDEDYIRGLDTSTLISLDKEAEARRLGAETRTKAEQNLQTSYNQALAQQNATYANLSRDLARRRQGDVETAKATAAQLNPYSGANTAEQGYDRQINAEYDRLQGDLDTKAAAAMAALASGNAEAYAKIQQSMADDYAQSAQNVSAIMNQLQNRDLQSKQFNLSLAKESRIADTQEKKDFLDNLERFGAGIPEEDINSFLTSGSMTPAIKSIMKQGMQANFAPAEIASFIQMGTQKQRNQEFNEWAKQQSVNQGWDRIALSLENSLKPQGGGAGKLADLESSIYKTALTGVFNNTQKFTNVTERDLAVDAVIEAFNNEGPKGAVRTITNLAINNTDTDTKKASTGRIAVAEMLAGVEKSLDEYKNSGGNTGFISGSIENIVNKIGQSTDPKLAKLKADLQQITQIYRRSMTGAAFSQGEMSEYKNFMPDISSVEKLNIAKLQSFKDIVLVNQAATLASIMNLDTNTVREMYEQAFFGSAPSTTTDGFNTVNTLQGNVPVGWND